MIQIRSMSADVAESPGDSENVSMLKSISDLKAGVGGGGELQSFLSPVKYLSQHWSHSM